MPRIETQTLAEHRDWRRNQLIDAAASIAMESGGAAITVAAVAQRAGLSRTSVYEYFGSGSELVADLVIDELSSFAETLNTAVADCTDARCIVTCWVKGALTYIADGRHLLAKALNATAMPQSPITDASTKRIESGHDAEEEIAYATSFCINGLMSK